MESSTYLGITLIIIGVLLQLDISSSVLESIEKKEKEKEVHFNIKEVDTYYENQNSIEYISYVDPTFTWPTERNYYITNPYSVNHPAIDIVTNHDLSVYSAYSGEVITNSYKQDNGNYLVIKQDNGYYALYAHLSNKLVAVGTKVKKGQVIGIMGKTGKATGIHLHFSIWSGYPHNSQAMNPLNFY